MMKNAKSFGKSRSHGLGNPGDLLKICLKITTLRIAKTLRHYAIQKKEENIRNAKPINCKLPKFNIVLETGVGIKWQKI